LDLLCTVVFKHTLLCKIVTNILDITLQNDELIL